MAKKEPTLADVLGQATGPSYSQVGPTLQDVLGEATGPSYSKISQTNPPKQTGTKPPTYAGTYEDQLADLYDRIQNREDFSYDVNADPLYQNYRDQYIQGGKRSMRDTMGQAAGLTGGYGSTYSQQAGQQAYDAYLQQLTDKIPELYNMAYGMYQDKGDDMMQQYSMLGQLRDTEYNRYRDELSDYNYRQETAYQHQQQAYSRLLSLIQSSGYRPTDKELEEAGMRRKLADRLRKQWEKANKPQKTDTKTKTTTTVVGKKPTTPTSPTAPTVTDIQQQATEAYEHGDMTYEEYMTVLSTIGSHRR